MHAHQANQGEGYTHLNLEPKEPSYLRASAYSVRAPCMRLLTYAVSLLYFCHAMAVDTSAPTIDPVASECTPSTP